MTQRSRSTHVARAVVPTVVAAIVLEVTGHGPLVLPAPIPSALLVASFLCVIYASLTAGYVGGAASAALLVLYSLHFFSPADQLVDRSGRVLLQSSVVLVVGAMVSVGTAALKARDDRVRQSILDVQHAYADDLIVKNRQLTASNNTLEAFSHAVSHDLKEPTRAVNAFLGDALEEEDPAVARELIGRARVANERLSALLSGLLELGRANLSALDLEATIVRDVLASEECCTQFEPARLEKNGRIEIDPDIPPVMATHAALCQIFGNLILNGLKHNPKDDPVVRVHAGGLDEAGQIRVLVDDNGPGFPMRAIQSASAPDRALRSSHGTAGGFGLLITRRTIERLGGSMTVMNTSTGGRVVVTLPLAADPVKIPLDAGDPARPRTLK